MNDGNHRSEWDYDVHHHELYEINLMTKIVLVALPVLAACMYAKGNCLWPVGFIAYIVRCKLRRSGSV